MEINTEFYNSDQLPFGINTDQKIVKDVHLTRLKRKMSDAETEALLQDPSSHAYKDILAGIFGDTLLTKRDALGRLDAVKGNKRKKRKIDFDRHPSRKWELPIDTTTIRNHSPQKTTLPLIDNTKDYRYFWNDFTNSFINSEMKYHRYYPSPTKWSGYSSYDDSALGTGGILGIIVSCIVTLFLTVCCVLTCCLWRRKQISAFRHRTLIETTTPTMVVGTNNVTMQANSSNLDSTGSTTREAAMPLPYHPPHHYSTPSVGPLTTAGNSASVKGIVTGTSINARPRPVVIQSEQPEPW